MAPGDNRKLMIEPETLGRNERSKGRAAVWRAYIGVEVESKCAEITRKRGEHYIFHRSSQKTEYANSILNFQTQT